MVGPLRHRQTKEAETDMFNLPPPRHISTLLETCRNSGHASSAAQRHNRKISNHIVARISQECEDLIWVSWHERSISCENLAARQCEFRHWSAVREVEIGQRNPEGVGAGGRVEEHHPPLGLGSS